jgi:energy-coupling factor transporter ATP-binding protein EcfA2
LSSATLSREEPLLRTLAPALRELERRLRAWLNVKHSFPLTTLQRATLEGLAGDLDRQAEALQEGQPLLVIMLMGGTGVGKSTLLNALAGGAVAHASFQRPTTRDPVVYHHQSVSPQKLDTALQHCKLVAHDRPALQQKVLVDTPDLDSNDVSNREKLFRLLPVADIVLYVGSQEKYHDQIGWQLFLEQRQRRAFAFVLNKWDRCLYPTAGGLRPDEDLLRDLRAEGFEQPLLFRTCAQHWVDHPWQANGQPAPAPPAEGEQFPELVRWLEAGLSRLEIEAIKAHGVSQLLHQLQQALSSACPPDLTAPAERISAAWARLLGEEARAVATVLLNTLEPYQKEIEHHFARERQSRFTGVMGLYLQGLDRLRFAGSTLQNRLPLLKGPAKDEAETPQWDLDSFARACSAAAAEQHLESRLKALSNRLLVEADALGIPLHLLSEPTEELLKLDWRGKYAQAMFEVIAQIEQAWSQPRGVRAWLQRGVVLLANTLPLVAFVLMVTVLLWQYFMEQRPFQWGDLVLPLAVTLGVLVLLQVLVGLVFPFRWQTIRADVERKLQARLQGELLEPYGHVPAERARVVLGERREVEAFLSDVSEVTRWLEQREQASTVLGLYGK